MSIVELEFLEEAYKLKIWPIDILDQIFKGLKFFKWFEKDVRKVIIENSELVNFSANH